MSWQWTTVADSLTLGALIRLLNRRMRGLQNELSTGASFLTISDGDATPSVAGAQLFLTANTGATTVTDLDDGVIGQEVTVVINDANTTVDFTGSGLKGNAGVDWSPASGDFMRCVYDGTDWLCAVHEC